jgi:uncharacterized membrane protein YeiB
MAAVDAHSRATDEGKERTRERVAGVDIARGFALVGVVLMNWVAAFTREGRPDDSALGRLFHYNSSPISTRFAATFVMVAGIGISLLTARSRTSGDPAAVSRDRWRLRRRALVLFAAAYPLHWVLSGEILHFYACYFIVASFVIAWPTRRLWWLAASALIGAVIYRTVVHELVLARHKTSLAWLAEADIHRPKQLVADVVGAGIHALLPWIAFVFVGMVIGRLDLTNGRVATRLMGLGVSAVTVAYTCRGLGRALLPDRHQWIVSTDPPGAMPLFVLSAGGVAACAIGACLYLGRRFPTAAVSRRLALAGQQTFSIYYLHGWLAYAIGRFGPSGRAMSVTSAVALALAFWVVAVFVGALYKERWGHGPAEVLLRRFSDDPGVRAAVAA